jgi:uncharacterized membrane protein (DUF485 family)
MTSGMQVPTRVGRTADERELVEEDRQALDALAARRLRVALWLTGAMLVVYFAFILLIATTSLFPLKNPALISMPLASIAGFVVSLATRDRVAEERFYEAERRVLLGAPATATMQPAVARRRPAG